MSDDAAVLVHPRFPRSAAYDPRWMIENWMGPNALWLAEWLCEAMDLQPGQRVLDLGCGRAATSVFLAREFGVQVVAADHWIDAAANWRRIRDAGCAGQVMPLQAEAHSLPFAADYFDAVVSIDAYHYFGTNQLYLHYLSRFVVPGGRIGFAVPGLTSEPEAGAVPAELAGHWHPEFWSFHTPAWWSRLWTSSGAVDVEVADQLDDGWRHWLRWTEACLAVVRRDGAVGMESGIEEMLQCERDLLLADGGVNLTFTRLVATLSGKSVSS